MKHPLFAIVSIVLAGLVSACAVYEPSNKNVSACAKLGTCSAGEEKEEDPYWCSYFGVCPKEETDDSEMKAAGQETQQNNVGVPQAAPADNSEGQ